MHYAHCTLHIAHCTLQVRARERVFRNTFPYAYQVFVYILAFAHSYSVSLARRLVASARACLSARPRAHVRLVCEFFLATRFHMRTKCICIYTYKIIFFFFNQKNVFVNAHMCSVCGSVSARPRAPPRGGGGLKVCVARRAAEQGSAQGASGFVKFVSARRAKPGKCTV